MLTYFLKVIDVIRETDDTVTIYFKQPNLKKIKYEAGQYLSVILKIGNRKYVRPYSLSSTPAFDDSLNITVKKIKDGIVSSYIFDQVNEGDIIEVIPPMGSFTFNKADFAIPPKTLVLWAGGSGITPLYSIVKKALLNEELKRVVIVYSSKNKQSTIFYNQLKGFQEQYRDRLKIIYFFSQGVSKDVTYCYSGRLLNTDVIHILNSIAEEEMLAAHYICGPHALTDLVKISLSNAGVDADYIYSEDFGGKHLIPANIKTRTIKLKKDDAIFNFEVLAGKTILEAALDENIDVPYSCQTGDCLLCLGQLLNGEVVNGKPINKVIPEYGCLLCSTYPMDDNVEILITNK
ncbi:MAG TPA: ferredoxin--NADP reductase [Mucilaginibacter sp.]|jgi:ring-1,2-phenylacetyl-CoA epoxidase subunit PaaE|nr:ferredoxin--NADP reductase [Mucilaginibacter sp.]